MRTTGVIRGGATRVFDALFPPACPLCGKAKPSAQRAAVCHHCEDRVIRVHAPFCRRCGEPFRQGEGSRECSRCALHPPAFDLVRAPFVYAGPIRDAILFFKYRRAVHLAPGLADLMSTAAGLGLDWRDYDAVVPVPLHGTRLRRRGFNPAVLLARRLFAEGGPPVLVEGLVRVKNTRPQFGLTVGQRRENLNGAIVPGPRADWDGRSVLLVDDIVTTGVTVSACAAVLKKAGATRVDVVALARAADTSMSGDPGEVGAGREPEGARGGPTV